MTIYKIINIEKMDEQTIQVAMNRINLISLNLSKIFLDLVERPENKELHHENMITLYALSYDLNDLAFFFKYKIVSK